MENRFPKIGSFQYLAEANIIKGRLEAEGVEVFIADNFTIDTDPLVSNAIGGVKLYVYTTQLDRAQTILNEIKRFSIDNEGNPVTCTKCGSTEIEVGTTIKDPKSLFSFIFILLSGWLLPFYIKHKYRCNNCGNEFDIK